MVIGEQSYFLRSTAIAYASQTALAEGRRDSEFISQKKLNQLFLCAFQKYLAELQLGGCSINSDLSFKQDCFYSGQSFIDDVLRHTLL
jgi:hypothetical protein